MAVCFEILHFLIVHVAVSSVTLCFVTPHAVVWFGLCGGMFCDSACAGVFRGATFHGATFYSTYW